MKRVALGDCVPGLSDLVPEVRGGAEYRGRARRAGEPWPNLLVEQDAARIVALERLSSLDLELSLRLASFADRMDGRGDPSLHAAQFQLFFIVKEVAPGAEGDFLWFGVPSFDSREAFPPAYRAKDGGKDDAEGRHELGHNHQSGDWTFEGTGEVAENLFTKCVFDKVCGLRPTKAHDPPLGPEEGALLSATRLFPFTRRGRPNVSRNRSCRRRGRFSRQSSTRSLSWFLAGRGR